MLYDVEPEQLPDEGAMASRSPKLVSLRRVLRAATIESWKPGDSTTLLVDPRMDVSTWRPTLRSNRVQGNDQRGWPGILTDVTASFQSGVS